MKKILIATTAFVLMSLVTFQTPAQAKSGHVHNHENATEPPPHGGTLRDCAPYKAEAVISGDTVKIYIYDKKMSPVKPEKDTADAEIEFPKKKSKSFKFKKNGDYYEATVAGLGKAHRYDLVVEFTMKGKKTMVDFGVDNIDQ